MSEEKFQVGQTVTPIESRWRGHDVITAGVPYVVKAIDAGGNLILQSDSPHLRIGWDVENFKLFAEAPPAPDHAELVKRLATAAEEAVKRLQTCAVCVLDDSDDTAETMRIADTLTAAIAQLPPELRGTP